MSNPRWLNDVFFRCQFAFNMCLKVHSETSHFSSRRWKRLQNGHGFQPITAVLSIANGCRKCMLWRPPFSSHPTAKAPFRVVQHLEFHPSHLIERDHSVLYLFTRKEVVNDWSYEARHAVHHRQPGTSVCSNDLLCSRQSSHALIISSICPVGPTALASSDYTVKTGATWCIAMHKE